MDALKVLANKIKDCSNYDAGLIGNIYDEVYVNSYTESANVMIDAILGAD